MSLSLQEIYGASATLVGDTLTMDVTDFVAQGLNDTTPSPTQILAAHLEFLKSSLTDYTDPTKGAAVSQFSTPDSIVDRNGTGTLQIARTTTINVYRAYSSTFDPDDVIS